MKIRKIRPAHLRFVVDPGDDPGDGGGATPPASNGNPHAPSENEPSDLGDSGKKAIQSERDARKAAEKRAQALEARVKEFEDSQKSEEQRNAERLAELEASNTQNALKARQYEAAAQAGIPLAAATRLQGSTLDELVADAENLKSLGLGATPGTPPIPQPDPSQGGGAGGNNDSGSVKAGRDLYHSRRAKK